MRIIMVVECVSCGHKQRCVMTDGVVSVSPYWRVDATGLAVCAGEECDDMAKTIGAKPVGPFLGAD